MKLFFLYLRDRRGVLILLAVFAAIFACVAVFSALPVSTALYALLLCLCVLAAAGAAGFFGYVRRHRRLQELLRRLPDAAAALPRAATLPEEDYQALVTALDESERQLRFQLDRQWSELQDYYTLWVHQIKTPIAAMDLLLRAEPTERSTELSQELGRIERYADMALQYLRLEGGGNDYVLRRAPLDGLVRQAVKKFAPSFIRKHIRLELQETGLTPLTDEKWLSFVIEQLLSNALKYTPEGGTISVYGAGEALVIADTGIGIAPEDLPRVFDKGFTGYNGRGDKKSTGIGLYLCRRVCDKLGHEIAVFARPGRGTRVRVGLAAAETRLE